MELIKKYFPELSNEKIILLNKFKELTIEWNNKINVISRKDIDNIEERHLLHSLAISKFILFEKDEIVMDVGTGGGFPGIPLAIIFPETKFVLVDSIKKKINVVKSIIDELGLKNVEPICMRVEKTKINCNYIISRAVTSFPAFINLVKSKVQKNNGAVIYLKGGDFADEIAKFKNLKLINISDYYEEEFFNTKKIIYYPINRKK